MPDKDPDPRMVARRCADYQAYAFGSQRVQLLRVQRGFVPSWSLFVAAVIGIAR